MAPTLFRVSCRIPRHYIDGRDTAVFWGHEHRYFATQEAAIAACERLRTSGNYGHSERPEYSVEEQHREDYPADDIGESEWRSACKEAGIHLEENHHSHFGWLQVALGHRDRKGS